MVIKVHRLLPLLVVASLIAGCGPKNTGLTTRKPWDPDHAQYFDDSVDFTMNPDSLSGQWMYSYKIELEGRVSLSDHIVAVRVVNVKHTEDADGRRSKDLLLSVEKDVKGVFPHDTFSLSVSETLPGYDSFSVDDPRLMDKVFLAFLRLYRDEDDEVGIHWHLSPLSEGLLEGIEAAQGDGRIEGEGDEYTLETEDS